MMKEDYRKSRRELVIVANGNIGHTNLPREAENQRKKGLGSF